MDTSVLVDSIRPDKNQPRKVFDKDHIEGLAQSIKVEGMINSIEIDENMMIITGECRWRASKLLGLSEIPVRINKSSFSEYERLRHQMAENVHQSGTSRDSMMNPMDTANGYARLYELKTGKDWQPGHQSHRESYGIIKEVAKEIGITEDTVHEFLKLLEQPEFVQKDILGGRPRTYYRVADSAPLEVQERLKKKIARGDYPNRGEIVQDVRLLQKVPDMAQLTLERQKAKENAATNRILNSIAKLALALEGLPLERVDVRERGIVVKQLFWLTEEINKYLEGKCTE